MQRRGILLIIIVALLVLVFFAYKGNSNVSNSGGTDKNPNTIEQATELSNSADCMNSTIAIMEHFGGPFQIRGDYSYGGSEILTGEVITERMTIWEDNVMAVFIKVPQSDSNFYQTFKRISAMNNTVNPSNDNSLYFKLGILELGQISSTADISQRAQKLISDNISSGTNITIKVDIPIYEGADAPPNFSFACTIQSA